MKALTQLFALSTLFVLIVSAANAQIPDDVTLDPVPGISGLSGALSLKNAGDGSNRLFIVQQSGTIRVIDSDGTLLPTPFLSLGNLVTSGGERGLLDMAFHPEFVSNGLFYLHYSAGNSRPSGSDFGDTVVAEFSVTGNPNVANNTPSRIILTVRQDFGNHNGGGMNFGPDGYLYLGLGDGGDGNDPCNRAQTLDPNSLAAPGSCGSSGATVDSLALLGKMLRVDIDNTTPAGANNLCAANGDGSAEYAIPATNPFPTEADRCGEVFLYGLRNPWRWSFDRQTADLWIGDVGQSHTEEISLLNWPLTGGDNMGWDVCEGSTLTGVSTTSCLDEVDGLPDSVLPVLEYPTGLLGRSITGGYRYRGPINSLRGQYIFGDAVSGNIWFATGSGSNWSFELFDQPGGAVRSFGEDEQGNVYAVFGSVIQRFNGDIELLFVDGFES